MLLPIALLRIYFYDAKHFCSMSNNFQVVLLHTFACTHCYWMTNFVYIFFFLVFSVGTGNSPAQSSTRSISPNSNSPGQFIHQQLHSSSGTTGSLAGSITTISSPQQPVCTPLFWNMCNIASSKFLGACENMKRNSNLNMIHKIDRRKKVKKLALGRLAQVENEIRKIKRQTIRSMNKNKDQNYVHVFFFSSFSLHSLWSVDSFL